VIWRDAFRLISRAVGGHGISMIISTIPWDQPATMIDLDGKAPLIATVRDCVIHYGLFKPFAKEQARVLLTQPVHREGQKTRTWLLNPDEIQQLADKLRAEG